MPLEIKTARTVLRLINESDLESVAALNLDPDVRQFFPDGIQTKEQTRQRLCEFMNFYEKLGLPGFVILDKASNEFIGRCGFGPLETGEIEVGYLIAKKFWGKGYASEALAALLSWSKRNIKADFIVAFAPINHKASHRVMEKCGMEYYKDEMGHGVECKFYRIRNK